MAPDSQLKSMPPNPAPMLASPQIEPTMFLGKTSAGKAREFALYRAEPKVATETHASAIAGHTFVRPPARPRGAGSQNGAAAPRPTFSLTVPEPAKSSQRNTRKFFGPLFIATTIPFGKDGPSAADVASSPSV